MAYVRIRDRVALVGKGFPALLEQLTRLFADPANKLLQRFVVDAETRIIHLERLIPEEEVEETQAMGAYAMARQKPMDEYILEDPKRSPHQHLFEASQLLLREGLIISHLLLHPSSKAYAWLSMPRRTSDFFGAPIIKADGVPEDVLLLCGAKDRRAEPEDIEMSVKVAIP